MQVLVNGTKLANVLKSLETLTGGASELVTIKFDGKHSLWLYQEAKKSELIKVGQRIEVNGKKSATFTVNAQILAGICRRNQDLLLEYQGKEIKVSNQKSYEAKCLTVASEQSTKIIAKKLKKTALSQKFQDILHDAVEHLTIKDFFNNEQPIVLSVWSSKKRTVVGASDSYHGGAFFGKGTLDLEFHLPMNYALRLVSLLADYEAVEIGVDDTYFYLWNDDLQISWPLVAPKATLDKFKQVMIPANTEVAELKGSDVKLILANLKPLYEKLSHLRIITTKKDISFQVRSARGQAAEKIKLVGGLPKADLAINPLLLEDLLALLPDMFTVGFVTERESYRTLVIEADHKHGHAIYQAMLSTTK